MLAWVSYTPVGATSPIAKLSNDEFPTIREWMDEYIRIIREHQRHQWYLGDLFILGEAFFGEEAAQVLDPAGMPLKTLQNYAWVCRAIPISRRRERLSFSHHAAVASLKPKEQEELLSDALRKGLSVEALEEIAAGLRPFREPRFYTLLEQLKERAQRLLSIAPNARTRKLLREAISRLDEVEGEMRRAA